MNSEKIQWSMLCVQNTSNIYRKNAYNCMQIKSAVNKNIGDTSGAIDKTFAKSTLYLNKIVSLDESRGLNIFDENIDFSLGTTVPDPLPFGDKLRNLLEAHGEFILRQRQLRAAAFRHNLDDQQYQQNLESNKSNPTRQIHALLEIPLFFISQRKRNH